MNQSLSKSSNGESGEFNILFDVGDSPYVVGELGILLTSVKD